MININEISLITKHFILKNTFILNIITLKYLINYFLHKKKIFLKYKNFKETLKKKEKTY